MKRSSPEILPSGKRTYESLFEPQALFEFSKVINSSLDEKFILSHILLTMMGKTVATKGMILLATEGFHYSVEMVKGFSSDLVGETVDIKKTPKNLFHVNRIPASRYPWVRFFRERKVQVLLAMFIAERPVGFIAFGGLFGKRRLTPIEETYCRSLANISATAVEKSRIINELRHVNRRLDLKVQELNTLFDLSKEFGTLLDTEKQVRLLVFSLLGQIGIHRYVICLRSGPDMKVMASRVDGPQLQPELLMELVKVRKPVAVENLVVRTSVDLPDLLRQSGMRIVVPMQLQGETRGVIILGGKLNREEFSEADLEFISSLGNLAMISLENTRLFRQAIEKQRLEDELLIAREIQKGLLPGVLPTFPGISMAAGNISSNQVGGDYYDALPLQDGRWIIAIGDVSGKGTPAALLMANLQATIRALVPLNIPLSDLTGRVNDLLCHNTGGTRFVTFFWGILDPQAATINYVNAGHNYPILLRSDGTVIRFDKGGMILGVLPTEIPYEEETVQLVPGDLLLMFTDGVSEAMNRDGREYGEERLISLLRSIEWTSAGKVLQEIHRDVIEHAGEAPQSDDLTMMALKLD